MAERTDENEKRRRKVRDNLSAQELERLEKYGSIEFKSAGATRNQ